MNCRPSHILYKQLFASKINRKAIALKKENRPKHIIINIFFPGFAVDTCGPPKIQNTMMNQTVVPGEYAHFKCQVIMMEIMVMMTTMMTMLIMMMMIREIDFDKTAFTIKP